MFERYIQYSTKPRGNCSVFSNSHWPRSFYQKLLSWNWREGRKIINTKSRPVSSKLLSTNIGYKLSIIFWADFVHVVRVVTLPGLSQWCIWLKSKINSIFSLGKKKKSDCNIDGQVNILFFKMQVSPVRNIWSWAFLTVSQAGIISVDWEEK